jgi:hypothetical protein
MPDILGEEGAPAGSGSHAAEPGDSFSSLALEHGFFWETLWNHPDNAALREKRAHPHVLRFGDQVAIPPIRKQQDPCETDKRHRFRRRGVPSRIHFRFVDAEDKALAGKRYHLKVGERNYEGTTNGAGAVIHYVDADQTEGSLTIWPEEKYYPEKVHFTVHVSQMQPLKSTPGLKTRLNHLGFYCGAEDDEDTQGLREAVQAFQAQEKIEPTGELTPETIQRLAERYGV